MREKIIFLAFGLFISLMTLHIYTKRENTEPVTVATSQPECRIYQIETETPEVEPVQLPQKKFTPIDIELDAELQYWIYNYCLDLKISPALVLAVIERESNYNINAVGDNGEAIGLMQIQSQWHIERMQELGITDLTDSKQNIIVGVNYLLELFRKNPEAEWVLNAYNGGQTYADRMQEKGITTDYAIAILARAAEIERMMEGW